MSSLEDYNPWESLGYTHILRLFMTHYHLVWVLHKQKKKEKIIDPFLQSHTF